MALYEGYMSFEVLQAGSIITSIFVILMKEDMLVPLLNPAAQVIFGLVA
jgi:hypothetical protein